MCARACVLPYVCVRMCLCVCEQPTVLSSVRQDDSADRSWSSRRAPSWSRDTESLTILCYDDELRASNAFVQVLVCALDYVCVCYCTCTDGLVNIYVHACIRIQQRNNKYVSGAKFWRNVDIKATLLFYYFTLYSHTCVCVRTCLCVLVL